MTTFKDKLKNICNYSEKKINTNSTQLMYLDMISSEDEEYQRMIKQQNRELVVDALLDDKVEELNIFRENSIGGVTDSSSTMVIIPKTIQINMTAKKFETYQKLCNEVVDFLNKNTQNAKSSLDVTLQADFQTDYRKIMTKIQMCSNIIAMDGRVGSGTSILYGKKLIPYINQFGSNDINGLITHYSDLVDDDKVIVCRGNEISQPGLLLIDDQENGQYFLNQTPNWHKQYCCFKIK
jgi:hypothetical protein